MEILDMVPVDAIALRLYSLPAAATSLWAWLVAALAAAVGLWRIRAPALVDGKQQKAKQPRSAPPSSVPAVDETRPALAQAAEVEAPVATPSTSPSQPSTPSKVRFTAYYGGLGDEDEGVVDSVRRCADRDDDDNRSGVR